MDANDILQAALEVPRARYDLFVNVCDFCEEEVSTKGPDAVYYCSEHGCVEAYWHEARQ